MWGLVHVKEGLRYLWLSRRRKRYGWTRFGGRPRDIADHIVKQCWNGEYFQNSLGHYREFWARDFGMACESLLRLGYEDEVRKTLEYALDRYSRHGRVFTAISPGGKPFDFPPSRSVDSFAWLLRSLRLADAGDLVKAYPFLEQDLLRLKREVWDSKSKLIRTGARLSSMRDYALRESSCYDNCMLAMLAGDAEHFKICPKDWKGVKWKSVIREAFWTGKYFRTDLSSSRAVTSDSNIAPFISGVFDDSSMLLKCVNALRARELDLFFPLKYVSPYVHERMSRLEFFVPQWERSALWSHIGLQYIRLVKGLNPELARDCLQRYCSVLHRDGTLFECYFENGAPYRSFWYMADEGMLWVANLRTLL